MLREGDLEKIAAKMEQLGLAMPDITPMTLIVENDEGEIIAFAAVKNMPWLYLYFDEDSRGRIAAYRVLAQAENMLRLNLATEYMVGISGKELDMKKIAEKAGFETTGEEIYTRVLGDVLG
jgi:hypothetical protein